jgi:hypothetical protein
VLKALGCLLFTLTLTLSAADVTGKWSGNGELKSPDGTTDGGPVYMDLKQNGQEVTGTVSTGEDRQWAIQKGRLEGQKLSFEVSTPAGEGTRVFKAELTVTEDGRLEGTVEAQDSAGNKISGKLSLKRSA